MRKTAFLIGVIFLLLMPSYICAEEYVSRKGDVLVISVWGEPDLNQEVTINESGNISFPLIGDVKAAGLTLQQIDDQITFLLKKDYLVNPDVTVSISKLQFYVAGEVKRPGAYPLTGGIGLLQAVTLAGGFTDFASRSVNIIRQIDGKEVTIKVNVHNVTDENGKTRKEYIIRPNDMIVVPKSFF